MCVCLLEDVVNILKRLGFGVILCVGVILVSD